MASHPDWSTEKASWDCMKETTGKTDEEVKVKMQEMKECVLSEDMNLAMAEIANRTNSLVPARNYVPWVLLNGKHVPSAENGFIQRLMCTAMLGAGKLPAACTGIELLQTETSVTSAATK